MLRVRGEYHLQAEHGDLALADFNEALPLTEGNPSLVRERAALLLLRGRVLRERGKYGQALADFEALQPLVGASERELGQFLIERGATLERDGQGALALADFNRAIELNVDTMITSRAFGWRAMLYAQGHDFPRAFRDIAVAQKLTPDCGAEYINNLCWIQVLSGEVTREARTRHMSMALYGWPPQYIGQCGSWLPMSPNLLDSRAVVRLLEGDLPEALHDAQAAVAGDSSDGEKRYTLGLVLKALGRQAESDSELAAARRQFPPGALERYVHPAAGVTPPPSQRAQAEAAIARGMAVLDGVMKDHGAKLPRAPTAGTQPYRVAAMAFPDRQFDMPYRCVGEMAGRLGREIDLFNEALGRRLFVTTTADMRDVLVVIGEPDPTGRGVPLMEPSQPHERLFLSYRTPHAEPRGATLYYRDGTGELLYAQIEKDWDVVRGKDCWSNFARDLALIATSNLYEKIGSDVWPIGIARPADSNLATHQAVLLCHHFGPADATREQKGACAWRMIELFAR